MARQIIDTGTLALNGQDGDTNREAADKCNANFSELYSQQENFVRGAGVVAAGSVAVFEGTTGNQLGSRSISDFEPAQTPGTASQYRNGLKQLVEFAASVRSSALTGISFASSAVVAATDTVLSALGKLQAQLSLLVPVSSPTDTNPGRLLTVGYGGLGARENLINRGTGLSPDGFKTGGTVYGEFTGVYGATRTGWLCTSSGTSAQNCMQKFTDSGSAENFVRVLVDGTWRNWVRGQATGDFGLGGTLGLALPGSNANQALQSGSVYATPATWTGSPYAGTDGRNQGYIYTAVWSAGNYMIQRWVGLDPTWGSFQRHYVNSVWRDWTPVYDGNNAATDPSNGGLMSLTTVSGFTVFKYLNGQMCLTGPIPTSPTIAANVNGNFDLTIPSVFNANFAICPTPALSASTSYDFSGASAFQVGFTTIKVFVRNGATAQTFNGNLVIWGRWK